MAGFTHADEKDVESIRTASVNSGGSSVLKRGRLTALFALKLST